MTQSATQVPNGPPHFDLPPDYVRLHSAFGWEVPAQFNIAQVCSGRWAHDPSTASRVAVRTYSAAGEPLTYSYAQLQSQANRLSNALRALGVCNGDRVAIVMPQRFETAVAYMAVLQLGAVAVPLSMLFGPDALAFRLQDSDAAVVLADPSALPAVQAARATCPAVQTCIRMGAGSARAAGELDYADLVAPAAVEFSCVDTASEAPAVLIYTSGTTGNPKGALIPHRALLGNLSGFICSQNGLGSDADAKVAHRAVFWSPADWAWTGGLMDALLPTLYFGCTIVASSARFDAELALRLMGHCGVTHTFLFPTAIKAMMKAFAGCPGTTVKQQFNLVLQACMSAGEAMGDAVFSYCEQQLGIVPNEMFGQTEINYIVGNSARHWPPRPGSMGMGYPGHRVAVLDAAGQECAPNVVGEVALHRRDVHGNPDPIFFLGYWKNPAATDDKFTGEWCRTGDLALRDAQGYFWYQGRADDVFKSAGYRIGPGEIENCLVKHAAVLNAAVVPKPDAQRGAVVKAYVVIAPDWLSAQAERQPLGALHQRLTVELQNHVKGLLAPYEYPKEIEFIDALPMTSTGKVQRRVLRLQEQERARTGDATPATLAGL